MIVELPPGERNVILVDHNLQLIPMGLRTLTCYISHISNRRENLRGRKVCEHLDVIAT